MYRSSSSNSSKKITSKKVRTTQPWQIAKPISDSREHELRARLTIQPNTVLGVYPFKGMKLSRADVEWLLAAHERGRGPVDWNDRDQRSRLGLDLRGADLSETDLSGLPLANLIGALDFSDRHVTTEQRLAAAICLDGANCRGIHLEGARLQNVSAKRVRFQGAFLQEAVLRWGDLTGAHFREADLSGTDLSKTHLEDASLRLARVYRLNLERAILGADTNVDALWEKANVRGLDVRWGGADLSRVPWSKVTLGEDQIARQERTAHTYVCASRANRQLALQLQAQGLTEEAMLFNYRAQAFQRLAWKKQRRFGKYLFSAALNVSCGYGYRPLRAFLLYLIVVGGFATLFGLAGHMIWYEAIIDSIISLHGRGFFAATFAPGDPLAAAAAAEAVLGLLVEVVVLATVSRRLFS